MAAAFFLEVKWTAAYVEPVLWQHRTMLYAICFIAWREAQDDYEKIRSETDDPDEHI
jgi:hypothetical protein